MCARDLDAWQQALDLAEADLRERERRALQSEPTPQELRAFADERDKLAADRNGLAAAYDEQALVRDSSDDRSDSLDDRHRAADARQVAAEDRQRASDDRDAAAHRDDEMQQEISGLREALQTRLQIGQAEGLLMARYSLDPDAAYRLLIKLSQETHIKLRTVAARLVADAAQQAGAGADDGGTTGE